MLELRDVEVLDKTKLNIHRKKTKKNQILLYDTKRRIDDFINMLRFRNNGLHRDVPHFVVSKLGHIYQIYNTDYSSVTFDDFKMDKRIIKVAIENLGWLNKNTITGILNNWIGDPYRTEPHIRNWRNYFFWDKYTDEQMASLKLLCDYLCEKHNIPNQSVPSQGFLENVSKFKGIVCKSNFSNIYTDINPSFDFSILKENAKENNK